MLFNLFSVCLALLSTLCCFQFFFPELLPSTESPIPSNINQNTDSPRPQAKKKPLLCSSHGVLDTNSDPVTGQDMSPTPRSILKHSGSSCSFTDSVSLQNSFSSQRNFPLSPESSDRSHSPPLSPSSEWCFSGCLDRKQVRFSPVILARGTGFLEGPDDQEHGEHDLLDQDCSPSSDQEGGPNTIESTNASDLPLTHYAYKEKDIGDTDSEPLIGSQSSPITNETDSSHPELITLCNEKIGEFHGPENWNDCNEQKTSNIQTPFGKTLEHQDKWINKPINQST